MRANKKSPLKPEKKTAAPRPKRSGLSYSKNAALLEDAITQMNAGKYGRSSAALKELLSLDPHNMEARRLFATLHLRLGSLIPARQAFDSLIHEALERQDYWLAESLLREYLAAGPRCVPFLEKLGDLYEEKGDALEAVNEYGKAIDILIEDPDVEHPHRASELFAKIRELAPASPVAFRLASSFDAQTGVLVARPMAALASEASDSGRTDAVQPHPTASTSSSELMVGAMRWDQGDDGSATCLDSAEAEPAVSPEPGEPLTGLVEHPAEVLNDITVETPVASGDASFLETSDQVFDLNIPGISPNEHPEPIEPLQFAADQSIPDGMPESFSAIAEPPQLLPSGFDPPSGTMSIIEEDHPAGLTSAHGFQQPATSPLPWEPQQPAAVQVFDSRVKTSLPPVSEPAGAGLSLPCEATQPAVQTSDLTSERLAIPAQSHSEPTTPFTLPSGIDSGPRPMPWDQVQEAPVLIPDASAETVGPTGQSLLEGEAALLHTAAQPVTESISSLVLSESPEDAAVPILPTVLEPIVMSGQPPSESTWRDREPGQTGEDTVSGPVLSETAEAAAPSSNAVLQPVTQSLSGPETSWPDAQQARAATEAVVELMPCEPPQEAPVPLGAIEVSAGSAPSDGVAPLEATPSAPPPDPLPPSPNKPAFSWKAVFSRGWRAADYSPAPVLSSQSVPYQVHRTDPPVTAPEVATGDAQEPALGLAPAPSQPIVVSRSTEDLHPTVTDALIRTGDETVGLTKGEADTGLPARVEEVPYSGGLEIAPALDGPIEVMSPSIINPPAIPLLTEFRLLASDSVPSVELPPASEPETSESPVPEIEVDTLGALAPTHQSLCAETTETPEKPAGSGSDEASDGQAISMAPSARPSHAAPLAAAPAMIALTADPVLQEEGSTSQPFTTQQSSLATSLANGAAASTMSPSGEPDAIPQGGGYPSLESAVASKIHGSSPETRLAAADAGSRSLSSTSHGKTEDGAVDMHSPMPSEWQPLESGHEPPAVAPPLEETVGQTCIDEAASATLDEEAPVGLSADEWIRTGASIRVPQLFISTVEPAFEAVTYRPEATVIQPVSAAATAVDILFASSGRFSGTETTEAAPTLRPGRRFRAKLARAKTAISIFVGSCFCTTRAMIMSLVGLVVFFSMLGAMAVGLVAVLWIVMEESPSSAFHNLTRMPPRTLPDGKNGYGFLLGFNAPLGQDPIWYQQGQKSSTMIGSCINGLNSEANSGQPMASALAADRLFRGQGSLARFKSHADSIKGWSGQNLTALARYAQWLKSPLEDWEYGQSVRLPCASIVFVHQLYVAEGFLLGTDVGIDRLEADMEAWRTALAQATTLGLKAMAIRIVADDAAVASELLVRPDSDVKTLGRITRIVRPLSPGELSIRWPMQSELVWASKNLDVQLKAVSLADPPLQAAIASMLPLPKQRRLNQYAEYYEAASKAAAEGGSRSMPKRSEYIHVPANSPVDYLGYPIENIIGLEPLPEWDRYAAQVGDLDAHLRLVSLQAWLRRGTEEGDLLARIAKAGQNFYDPYTGFPMLVNQKKGLLYSVGHDGRDQDADSDMDIVVTLPAHQGSAPSTKSTANSSVLR